MRISGQLAFLTITLVCILALAACGSTAPVLRSVAISPPSATISASTTQQFTASAQYSDGSAKDATSLVAWSSSNAAVAKIAVGGVATALASGTTTITATLAGAPAATATLNVNQLQSVAVTPSNPSVANGKTQQFTATGTYKNADGTSGTNDVTSLATWTSGTTTVATITNTGLATAVGAGSSSISAALDGVTGSTNMTVGGPVAVSLRVSPTNPSVAIGKSDTFTAQEIYSDGTPHPLSGTVTWASGTAATATIATLANAGFALGHEAGTSTITATEGTLTGNTTLTVTAGKTHFAYVSNYGSNTIQWYSVNSTTSPYLNSQGTLPATAPVQTVIHPSGQYLYYTDSNSNVWVTTMNSSTGALTATTFAAQPGGAGSGDANFMTIDPYGRFLYVSDDGGNTSLFTIYGFKISPTDGSLTPISGSPFSANLNLPECLIIDPTGTYLYAVNEGNSTLSAYTIDQNTGALTPLSTPTFPTGSGPFLGAFDPSGTHLYVANTTPTNSISGFSIGTGGILTSVGPDAVVTGATSLVNLVVDPSGTHIYALDSGNGTTNGQIFGYSIGSGGVIGSAISGTPVATGVLPFGGIVIDATGTLLAADNNTSNTISLYTIGAGGALTAVSPANTGTTPFFVTFYNAP
jgi:6-phosphogluconolactonase (cycloisomerase 2 family)